MKFFNPTLENTVIKAIHYIEDNYKTINGKSKKIMAIDYILEKLVIPSYLTKHSTLYNFLNRNLGFLKTLLKTILINEIDRLIEKHVLLIKRR